MAYQSSIGQLYTPIATPPLELQSVSKPLSSYQYPQLLPPQNNVNASFQCDAHLQPQNSDPSVIGLSLERADSTSSWASSSVGYPLTPDSSSIPAISNRSSNAIHYDSSFITVDIVLPERRNSEGKYSCTLCDRAYAQTKHLKRHMMKHTGERPYGCEWCKKRFTRADIRKLHIGRCKIRRGLHSPGLMVKESVEVEYLPVSVQMHREDEDERVPQSESVSSNTSSSSTPTIPDTQNFGYKSAAFVTPSAPLSGPPSLLPHIVQPVPVHDARWRSHQQFLPYPNSRNLSPQLPSGQFFVPSHMDSHIESSTILPAFADSYNSSITLPSNNVHIYSQPNSVSMPYSGNPTGSGTASPTVHLSSSQFPSLPPQKFFNPSPPLSSSFYKNNPDDVQKFMYPHGPYSQGQYNSPTSLPPNYSTPLYSYTPPQPHPPHVNHNTIGMSATPSQVHPPRPGQMSQYGLGIYVNDHES